MNTMPNANLTWRNTVDLRSGHDLSIIIKNLTRAEINIFHFLQVKLDAEFEFTDQNMLGLHPEALLSQIRLFMQNHHFDLVT